jgi:hypothetical protein
VPWPVYSERFISAYGQSAFWDYVVPPGKRAVVVDITASNVFGVAGQVQVHAVSSVAWTHVFQASVGSAQWTGRLVLYQGELLRVYNSVAEIGVNVSGYLLEAPLGRRGDAPPVVVSEPSLPVPSFS